jgi:thiol-disulfide isomerase/thioredoxin
MRRLPFPPRLLLLSTALALIAATATYVLLAPSHEDERAGEDQIELAPGDTVPLDKAAFTTFDSREVSLSSLRGTPVVVNFFASTCAPCIKEMPALEQVHQELGDQVHFLGLDVGERAAAGRDFVRKTGVTYQTARDPESTVIGALGGTVLPTTVVLDASGNIVATHPGQLTAAELRKLLADELHVQGT